MSSHQQWRHMHRGLETSTTVFQGDSWRLQRQASSAATACTKSSIVTTQNHREPPTQHKLCHTKCLGQLSNRSRRKIQKLKAAFSCLRRHAEQQPSLWYLPLGGGTLPAAFCRGHRGALPAPFTWHPHPTHSDAGRLLRHAPRRPGGLLWREGNEKVVPILQASPTYTWWLRWGNTGKVTVKASILFDLKFTWSESFFSNYRERKFNSLGNCSSPLRKKFRNVARLLFCKLRLSMS